MSIDKKNKGSNVIEIKDLKRNEEVSVDNPVMSSQEETKQELFSSVEEPQLIPFSGLFEGEKLARKNNALSFVINHFDDLVSKLGLENADFFTDFEKQEDFVRRLEQFSLYVDNHLKILSSTIPWNEDCVNFSDNWQENLKAAAYYVFFLHYGEKRKGEFDESGEPLDYVYHVVNSALSNLIVKERFFCEPTLIATMFHDVLENWNRGILAQLDVKASEQENPGEVFHGAFSSICEEFDNLSGKSREELFDSVVASEITDEDKRAFYCQCKLSNSVGIKELVEIVTKSTNNKSRSILEILERIINYEGADQFSAFRAIAIKLADRLDNIRTFISLSNLKGSEDKAEKIKLETIYFFLALAISLQMWNVVDWLYDYIAFQDPEERRRRLVLRKQPTVVDDEGRESTNETLIKSFRRDFQKEMRRLMQDKTLTDGQDYILEFRPTGFRYEELENAERLIEQNAYAKDFQNFIIFRPVEGPYRSFSYDDSSSFQLDYYPWNEKMVKAAVFAFQKLFPSELGYSLRRGELDSVLGRCLLENRTGIPFNKNGYGGKYGVGIWSVFSSAQDVSSKILGHINRGWFYSDKASFRSRDECFGLMDNMEDFVRRLSNEYNLIDFCRGDVYPSLVQSETRQQISRLNKDLMEFIGDDVQNYKVLSTNHCRLIEQVVDKLVMTLLMKKPIRAKVTINGVEYKTYLPDSEYVDLNSAAPLVFTSPMFLGRRLRMHGPTSGYDPESEKQVSHVHYTIDLSRGFSQKVFNKQTAFLDKLLDEYKEDLLQDNVRVVRRRVARASDTQIIRLQDQRKMQEQRKRRKSRKSRTKPNKKKK